MNVPQKALLVAGIRSHCGKTTLTLCLMAALHKRGLSVQGFKVGPDFIDPSHHAALTQKPSYNVDSWMGGMQGMQAVWRRLRTTPADIIVGEGVMGLFDGAHGLGGPGSTAHVAQHLNIPLLLVLDVRGQGQSAAATALGFVKAQPDLRFVGAVCTHVGSDNHKAMLRESFAEVLGSDLPLLGLLPRAGVPELSSRHLGLIMGHEAGWEAKRDGMATWVEEHLDVDALLRACPQLPPCKGSVPPPPKPALKRVAIARDEAFCFLYPDMPVVLEELGAQCVFFSPLRDTALPEHCEALYFPGGYPELHAAELSANTDMRDAVRNFAATGRRVYGECGGYMYLMRHLHAQGAVWPMSACLPLDCTLGEEKAALGYREVQPAKDAQAQPSITARGHEFHYTRIDGQPAGEKLWQVRDRQGKALPAEGCAHGSVWGSWTHLYPEGARALLQKIFDL